MRFILIGLLNLPVLVLCAQLTLPGGNSGARNVGNVLQVQLAYGAQMPGGDLADRFGYNFSIEGGLEWMTAKGNWTLGLHGQYLFGNRVKTDVLAALRTDEGYIIGNDRSPADIFLRERGLYLGLRAGKLIPLGGANARSGIKVAIGAGLLQHRIRIQKDPLRSVPQLQGDYRAGYDRLTNGPALHQFIGYQLLSRDGRINLYAGLEFFQAFTQNRRLVNFDTRTGEPGNRLDLLSGLRLGWILPFYSGKEADEIYY